jgi:EAL domain-containing protein (putative c-di-GMP-specific phosphodiesterase class I)/GGDEF domain-containing protein/PAS domain-containing protein
VSDNNPVPLIIVSSTREPVEALNSLLRRQGVAAHCTWIPAVADLPDALEQINPEMLLCVAADDADLDRVAKVRDARAQEIPLLVIRGAISEEQIASDIARGARDTLTLENLSRAHAVIARELKAYRIERALRETMHSAHEYRSQLETVMTRSHDAIAQVQEGILVDANQSWLDLIGAPDAQTIVGQPVMDFFEDGTQVALKGALVACVQGRWSDRSLNALLLTADGSSLELELVLTQGQHEGEPSVRLMVPTQQRKSEDMATDLADAVKRNPRSGLLYRAPLLEAMQKRMALPVQAGSRFLIFIRPDAFARVEREVGVIRSEAVLTALCAQVRAQLAPADLLGHFGGASLLALIERGNTRDAELWAERLLEKIRRHDLSVGDRQVKTTVCMGLAVVPSAEGKLEATIAEALEAVRKGRSRGGDQLCSIARTDADARVQAYDAVWVKHLRAALAESRFRLVQQPIASLAGGGEAMFDMLVRMLDRSGKEVLPSEFMAAAERNDLVTMIDRWVIMAAARFAQRTNPGCLFVRMSRASVLDSGLVPWLRVQLSTLGLDPKRLCIQVTEEIAARHPAETRNQARALKDLGLRFALEHFGIGIDPLSLLDTLPLDFIKVDGSLMQGLTGDELLQSKVGSLIDAARTRDIETIAERVEDANTMAVLWQLGVQHLQGFLIQAPEEVTISTSETQTVPVLRGNQAPPAALR